MVDPSSFFLYNPWLLSTLNRQQGEQPRFIPTHHQRISSKKIESNQPSIVAKGTVCCTAEMCRKWCGGKGKWDLKTKWQLHHITFFHSHEEDDDGEDVISSLVMYCVWMWELHCISCWLSSSSWTMILSFIKKHAQLLILFWLEYVYGCKSYCYTAHVPFVILV